jgi:hypothetical protein
MMGLCPEASRRALETSERVGWEGGLKRAAISVMMAELVASWAGLSETFMGREGYEQKWKFC